jgi:hypothetical protein
MAPPAPAPAAKPQKTMAINIGSGGGSAAAGRYPGGPPAPESRDADDAFDAPTGAGLDVSPYLARLTTLADELTRALGAPVPGAAAQLPVARLAELLEDLRTVGLDELARQLTPLLDRLRAALVAADLATVLAEVAAALRNLATGSSGGTPSGGGRKRGWAFWR